MSWPGFALAASAALVLTPAVAALARRLGVVDRPGALKVHAAETPLLGGLAVATGWIFGALVAGLPLDGAVLGSAAVAFVVGFVDDVRPVAPPIRVAALLGAGGILWAAGAGISPLGPIAGAAAAVLAVGVANGVNLVDGLDGLAPGCIAISAAGLAILHLDGAAATSALAGAALGFLVWNRPPARIFLGDAGAYAIGVVFASGVALESRFGWRSSFAAALTLGVFVVEPMDAIVRRARHRLPMTVGDRDHTYDRLVRGGRPVTVAVGITWAWHAWLVGSGIALGRGGVAAAVAVLIAGAAAVWLIVRRTTAMSVGAVPAGYQINIDAVPGSVALADRKQD